MYDGSREKLGDAAYHQQNAANAETFEAQRREVMACITTIRAVGHVLNREGRRAARRLVKEDPSSDAVTNFNTWRHTAEQVEQRDPLLSWIRAVRNADLKEGVSPLTGQHLVMRLQVAESPDGPWVDDSARVHSLVKDPPDRHLGEPIEFNSPVNLCELALAWYGNLVKEAAERFPY